ncbi:MAG TPA: hypothetical protein VIX15_04300 [Streptosporangiaceae bacterium]
MSNQSWIRGLGPTGLLCAGLLCTGLAGCGTAVASSPSAASTSPATTPHATGAGGAALATAATPQVGCTGVSQATSVTVTRHLLVREPVNGGARVYTQRHATKVRALFGDFCAAIAHADVPPPPIDCPADFGTSYTGTFYDGQRVLATFVYVPAGCQRVTLTAAGKTRGTFLIGKAAAAAPHLKADMAAVLGLPESQVYGAPSQTLSPVK